MTRFSRPSSSRTLDLTVPGDEHGHVVGDLGLLGGRLLADDRDLHLEVRRLDVGDQAPLEPRAQPLLERRDLLGQGVGGHDDLLLRVVQRVERVEELLLGRVLAGDELDVVHQEHVELAVAPLELVHPLEAQGVDEIVQEALGREVQHARVGVAAQDLLRDRVHQVRLSEADAAVQEERVVGARGRFGDGARRGVRELVGGADDEGVEREARVPGHGRAARREARRSPSRRRDGGLVGAEASKRISSPGKPAAVGLARRAARRGATRSSRRRRARAPRPSGPARSAAASKSTWRVGPNQVFSSFGIELALDLLEDGAPDLGHGAQPGFHKFSTAVEGLWEAGGREYIDGRGPSVVGFRRRACWPVRADTCNSFLDFSPSAPSIRRSL